MPKIVATHFARQDELRETFAFLRSTRIDLPSVASFIEDVYILGVYLDPKAYKHRAKEELKKMDACLLELVKTGVVIKSDQERTAKDIFQLGKIRQDIYGHEYRARRIIQDRDAYQAQRAVT